MSLSSIFVTPVVMYINYKSLGCHVVTSYKKMELDYQVILSYHLTPKRNFIICKCVEVGYEIV